MAVRTFDSLVPRLQPSVPGCPHATIVQYIRDSAIRTCERTLAWRYQVPQFYLMSEKFQYTYGRPINTNVHALFAAIVNKYPLKHLTLEQAISLFPELAEVYVKSLNDILDENNLLDIPSNSLYNEIKFNQNSTLTIDLPINGGGIYAIPARIKVRTGSPQYITQLTPDKFIVLPAPDDSRLYACNLYVALKPTRGASGMDEAVFNDLEEVIMHGALQHLLVLPDQPWSDRELAGYHGKQYTFQIAERRARANLGNMRNTISVRMQPFGA